MSAVRPPAGGGTAALGDGVRPDAQRSSAPATSPIPITVISPHRGWFDWRLGELWRYRDLVALFVWRDFVSVYKQTILGPAWHVIRPLLMTLTFTVVFGRIANLPTDGAPPFLFYMCGSIVWLYFSTCMDAIAKTFVANAQLLGKVYFPRLAIPVSVVISNLIALGIQVAILLLVLLVYRLNGAPTRLTSWVFAMPMVLLLLAGYATAGGIIVSALTTRYRDLVHLITFGLQLLMYATPVIYPSSALPPRYQWLAHVNPLAAPIEAFRRGLIGVGTVSTGDLVTSFAVMLVALVVGLMLFARVERTFMDTV